jgi:hypothetical protein
MARCWGGVTITGGLLSPFYKELEQDRRLFYKPERAWVLYVALSLLQPNINNHMPFLMMCHCSRNSKMPKMNAKKVRRSLLQAQMSSLPTADK